MIGLGFGNFQAVTQIPFSFGNALQSDGLNDFVTYPTISFSSGTVNFWFNTQESVGSTFLIAGNGSGSGTSYIAPRVDTNYTTVRVGGNSFNFNFTSISVNTWYMQTVTYDAGTVRCFLNGVESSDGAQTLAGNNDFDRFFRLWATANYYKCKIDEIAAWDAVLTPSDITNLYNSGNGDFATNYSPANLQAYWRMNGVSGDGTAVDEQGNYNGTLNNFDTATCWVAH
jgi:hypothetical protein